MPGPAKERKPESVKNALESGKLKVSAIDSSVRAILELLEKTGKFGANSATPEETSIDLPEHRQLIREAGGKGIVLLKNDKKLLPLDKSKIKTIAALGLAKECLAHGGGSASVNAHYKISPFDALQKLLGDSVELRYAQGMFSTPPYFNPNRNLRLT
jgi:beta-glucosidase